MIGRFLHSRNKFRAVVDTVQLSGRIFMPRDYVSFGKFSMRPLAFGHSLYMEMSPRAKNVMGHSLHQASSYETFEIRMSHSLHVSPLPKHWTPCHRSQGSACSWYGKVSDAIMVYLCSFLSPPVEIARWVHMSVCTL